VNRAKAVFQQADYRNIIAFGFYCIFTYLMVYLPVSIDLGKTYLGHGEVVFWSNYFWWFDYAISNFINPLWHNHIFYPLGLGIMDGIFPFLAFVPVTHVFGSVVSYNLYVLSSFVLSGYGMFLLSRFLFEDVYAGFIAGVIFAFFPFHFGAAMGHLHTFSIMWIPFFVLFFLKMYDNPTLVNVFLSSLFLAMNACTSWTITIMIAIFCLLYVFYQWKHTFSRNLFPWLVVFLLVSTFLMAPGLYIILSEVMTNEHMSKTLGNFIYYGADILGFIIPSPLHPIWGGWAGQIYAKFGGNFSENIVFIGYSVILLLVVGMFTWAREKFGKFVLFISIIFFILSIGAVLHVSGVWRFTNHNLTVMLPGIFTKYIPFLDMVRVPSRYDIMLMFCISLISGYGLHYVFEKISKSRIKIFSIKPLFTFLITAVILFEYMAVLPVEAVKTTPAFYYSIQRNDGNDPILEVPINLVGFPTLDSTGRSARGLRYYEYQKVHHKPFMGGYWSRISHEYAKFLEKDPVLREIFTGKKDIVDTVGWNKLRYLKSNYGVSHIILHKDFLHKQDLAFLISCLGENYILDNSISSDRLIIYSTSGLSNTTAEESTYIMGIGTGWHGLENWNNIPSRWISNNASILIYSNENSTVKLTFKAHSFIKPRTLEVYIGSNLQSRINVPTGFVNVSTSVNLHKGENVISLYMPEGCDRPCVIPVLNSKDKRCLSIGIQDIRLN